MKLHRHWLVVWSCQGSTTATLCSTVLQTTASRSYNGCRTTWLGSFSKSPDDPTPRRYSGSCTGCPLSRYNPPVLAGSRMTSQQTWRHNERRDCRPARVRRHNENDVTMTTAGLWRYGNWRHAATGCTTLFDVEKHGHTMLCRSMARPDGQSWKPCWRDIEAISWHENRETSLEIHQYLPQPVREPADGESKHWSSAHPRFFANNSTVYNDSASPVRCSVKLT